ncbi:MAG: primosomal protein N' [Coriobacteriia bacterium]|nr:primosomal protein N' [Coriobacteriia bacterium]
MSGENTAITGGGAGEASMASSSDSIPTTNLQEAYAQVILDIPSRALDAPFDYLVPAELVKQVEVGCSVLVDFGNRPALGYIVGISFTPPFDLQKNRIKPLREVLSTAFFNSTQVELAWWISRQYLSPISETIRLFTPPGSAARIRKNTEGSWELELPDVGPVDDRWVRLTEVGREFVPLARATKQRAILAALAAGELRVSELGITVENASTSLNSLERQGIVVIESRRRIRGRAAGLPSTAVITDLTDGQREALAAIRAALGDLEAARAARAAAPAVAHASPAVAPASSAPPAVAPAPLLPAVTPLPLPILLDGITGSGKTEVYLQAIRDVLENGGSAIMLVPEISLTPQTVARFRSRFGEQVAVLHSRLSAGERFDQWDMVRSGAARVVVGARSALFAPMQNLRLIVIDEEHESTYKQSSTPRYTTRAVAHQLARLSGALLVCGSATPSMESLAAVARGTMMRVSLQERPNRRPLPPIQVVDLTQQFKSGSKTMFSDQLREALLQTIEQRQKAILLLNRRGFAAFLLCRDCGFVPTCENCSTSYTLHEHPPRLVCHHCGAEQPVPARCTDCESPYLRQLSPGTQYVHDQLIELLPPDTTIVRMDADSTRGRYGHERRLDEFASADSAVLLGTQMIAKGLDFPEVTLVGVLIADTALKLPDFRAAERTYQLLEQVAGRAGRADKDGRVIVQTYWPEHIAIQAAASHDRSVFIESEAALRQQFDYPPYARLANIIFWSENLADVQAAAGAVAERLLADPPAGVQILGPNPCVISRRQRQYRWHVLIKAPLQFDLPGWLARMFAGDRTTRGVSRAIDIDPYDMM